MQCVLVNAKLSEDTAYDTACKPGSTYKGIMLKKSIYCTMLHFWSGALTTMTF